MGDDTKIQRRKDKRREHRSQIRHDQFISEYVQYKYFNIYSEAVEFYNTLNTQYPVKYDLRKTIEFRDWKAMVKGVAVKKPKRQKTSHANVQARPLHNLESHPQVQTTAPYVETPQSPREQMQSPDTGESEPASPNQSEHPQSPDTGESEPASPNQSEHPQSPDTGESEPASPADLQSRKHVYTDNLQLRIPLIPHISIPHTNHPTVTTETLHTVTEETLEEGTLQPSLYEELAPELIEKIIRELQLDPDLETLFTSTEEQIEFEQLGMDIDIDEDNALENKLTHW